MTTVTLTPAQAQFAAEAVAQGRYRGVDEVVQAGLALLQQAQAEVAAFVASLEEAEAEGEREGFLTSEEVHREVTQLIDEMAKRQA